MAVKMKTRIFLGLAAHCVLLAALSSCAEFFQDKIPSANEGSPGSLSDLLSPGEKISKLNTPAQFYAAPYYSSQEIRLTWEGVTGAAYYLLERAVASPVQTGNGLDWPIPDESEYQAINLFVYGTSYIDVILKSPSLDSEEYQNRYWYRVSALNPGKGYDESDPAAPVSAMLLSAPANVKATGGASVDYIDVTWDRTPGDVASYEIYRSENADGTSASMLGSALGNMTSYQNRVSESQQGKDFYYSVIAVNKFGNKSLQTKPAYGYARIFGAPDAPSSVQIVPGAGRGDSINQIKISWSPSLEPSAYFAVYRYSSLDSSLTRLTERTDAASWTDSQALKPGVYYYYKVQAIVDDIASGKALKSQFSSSNPEGYILSPPETLAAEKSTDGSSITVKWLPPIGSESERQMFAYKVYADTSMNGDFTACVYQGNDAADMEGYKSAQGLSVSNTFFKVSTLGSSGIESAKSSVVSPAPAAAIIQQASQHEFISNHEAANSSGVHPVKVSWKKPDNETPAFYQIQRSAKSGSGFSRINEAPLPAKAADFYDGTFSYDAASGVYTYIDRNETAKAGRKYFYRVLSLNQLEQGNFPSQERTGWGALTHTQYALEFNKTMKSALKKLTLMYKPGSTEKLGKESKTGTISGTIAYDGHLSGLGAEIIIRLDNYADFYIEGDAAKGVYFTLTGNSNTSANMSSNGNMFGTMRCDGMYPGYIYYDHIEIKGGAAGGGTYGVFPDGGFSRQEISWTVLE
jgi:hypothetical protein